MAEVEVPLSGVRAEADAIARELLELAQAEKSQPLKALAERLHALAHKSRDGGQRNVCPQCGAPVPIELGREPQRGDFRPKAGAPGVWECADPWHAEQAAT